MNNFMCFAVLNVLLWSALCIACDLPEPREKVNWNRLNGTTWYRSLLQRNDFKECVAFKNFKPTKEGFSCNFFNAIYPHKTTVIDYVRTAFGVYTTRHGLQTYVTNVCSSSGRSLILPHAKRDSKVIEYRDYSFYTDYKNYVLVLACGEGIKRVVGHTPQKNPTPDVIRLIHNRLAKIGKGWSEENMYFTGCACENN